MRSLGVDVSAGRGLDLVLLDGSSKPRVVLPRVRVDELAHHISELKPDVVAIDSPPAWGTAGGSRKAERDLARLGIHSYGTPSNPKQIKNPFFAWIKEGIRAFEEAAEAGFPRFRRGRVRGTAVEVFPHATAVVLAGCLPYQAKKKEWRASVLRALSLEVTSLRSMDLIDAALAALTGLYALESRFTALGDPEEGVIVLPMPSLPSRPYRRCTAPPAPEPQLHLPGLSPCTCGDPDCRQMTSGEFAPGHDAKRKAALWRQARRGDEALQELKRRGWELPPEMRATRPQIVKQERGKLDKR